MFVSCIRPSVLWHCWLGVVWPVKSSPKWPIMCRVEWDVKPTVPYRILYRFRQPEICENSVCVWRPRWVWPVGMFGVGKREQLEPYYRQWKKSDVTVFGRFDTVDDCNKQRQEAQLSQRDRATLRVIEYFAKSFKITQDHSKWHCWVWRV